MQEILENVNKFIDETLNGNILSPIIMIMILLTGILLTIRTKFLQVRKFGYSVDMTIGQTIRSVSKKGTTKKERRVSPFQAFSAAVAGTVGTGNIVGVAGALLVGGPGAIFWMWFSAFFGMVTNYSENLLGIYFRSKDEKGEWKGGAMYYIVHGIGKGFKWLAVIFAIFAVFSSIGFNFVQANSISETLTKSFVDIIPIDEIWLRVIAGVIIAIIAGLIIIGGITRIAKVTSCLVPFMAVAYMVLAIIVIAMNYQNIPDAFIQIFKGAFSFKAAGTGFLAYQIFTCMRQGIYRGIFSNEAGLGSSVMAHSSADVKEPVHQGLWGIFEVFLDTFIICTLSALMFITSGAITGTGAYEGVTKTTMGLMVFTEHFGVTGKIIYSIILPLFAFTTLVSWSYYGEKAIEYLFGFKSKKYYKIVYIILVVFGAIGGADLVWNLADTFNTLMAIPNLIALVVLSGLVAKITKNHLDRNKGVELVPMLSYDKELNDKLAYEIALENGEIKSHEFDEIKEENNEIEGNE